ncbi:FAD-dependent oxidoreductase [Mailhella massiliensis]|uniref:FAD-dependent oxidoreductase n=1 Tax=Mailhella massiliensis TaxID=1903261 RepID=A0A921DRE5_9BACT|nr:FAD-dependent oxidoreductase [Mailhella massiliensis]HJD97610.1 FAD-dependent oxidoreductase [Mailhella massiliensis]
MINTIDTEKCTGCGTCFKTCGLDVFRIDTDQPVLSPCMATCPAGTDIRGYNGLMQMGRIDEAAERLRERNPFPAVTGRVCPHLCEGECSRSKVDGAVNINALEQYLGDRTLHVVPEKPAVRHVHRIAVVGSGPAGLSCAWYLARAGYPVRVFEAMPAPGGMLRYGIPAYRLPEDVLDAQIEQLRALGVEFQCGTRVGNGCDCSVEDLYALGYKAVFLAPGATKSRKPGVPGEDLPGVLYGVEFLSAVRRNRQGRLSGRAVVIGGGAVAMDAAITARKLGASQVDLYCLESREEMPAFQHDIDDAVNAGVILHPGWGPQAVEGNGRVESIVLHRCLSVFNAEGRFAPVFDDAETLNLEAATVIFAIGQSSDLAPFEGVVDMQRGRITADPETFGTSYWNIFAAGDAVTGPSTVIAAITGGREAAISIDRLMTGGHLHSDRKEKRPLAEQLPGEGVMLSPRVERKEIASEGFEEKRLGFDDVDALHESLRCLTCGAKARVNYRDDCMTCFFCELRCPSHAIDVHPFKERLPFTLERNFGGF